MNISLLNILSFFFIFGNIVIFVVGTFDCNVGHIAGGSYSMTKKEAPTNMCTVRYSAEYLTNKQIIKAKFGIMTVEDFKSIKDDTKYPPVIDPITNHTTVIYERDTLGVCSTNLCNSHKGSLYTEVMKKFREKLPDQPFLECHKAFIRNGTFKNGWFDISEGEKPQCSVQYGSSLTYMHKSETKPRVNGNTTVLVGDKGDSCTHDYPTWKRVWCTCATDYCNNIGSPIHMEMLKIVKQHTGENLFSFLNLTEPAT